MKTVRILPAAALVLMLAAPSFAQTVLRSPGTYPVQVVIDSSLLPSPFPELPDVGLNIYIGDVTIRETTPDDVKVRFQGTDRITGESVTIRANFHAAWAGLTTATIAVDEQILRDAVVGIDVEELEIAKVDGYVTIDGSTERVLATIGPEPTLLDLRVQ